MASLRSAMSQCSGESGSASLKGMAARLMRASSSLACGMVAHWPRIYGMNSNGETLSRSAASGG